LSKMDKLFTSLQLRHTKSLLFRFHSTTLHQNPTSYGTEFLTYSCLVQLENGQDANLNLVTLFKSLGIQVTVTCMNVMDELATALIKMYSQEYEHSLLPPSHSRARIQLARKQRARDRMRMAMDPRL
jgi:hypothetical protein